MSGRRSRLAGNRGELEVVEILKTLFPDAHTTRNACRGTRVADSVDIGGVPLRVEVKYGQQPPVRAALKQAEESPGDEPAVAFTRATRERKWMVSMRSDFFMELLLFWKGDRMPNMGQDNGRLGRV